jgi:parallel beta-helix repeat protein
VWVIVGIRERSRPMRPPLRHPRSHSLAAMAAVTLTVALASVPAAALATGRTVALATGQAPRHPAKVIEVYPARHALAKALDQALPGDTLNIHTGRYREHVDVSTPDLTMQAAGDGRVVVDARCRANDTIYVTANGVTVDGLTVVGAAEGFGSFPSEIGLQSVDQTGLIENSVFKNTCDAEYGIQVFQSGSIVIRNNRTSGFSDSGIYIGAISNTPNGPLIVAGNRSENSHQGIIVEDSSGGTIQVTDNGVDGNFDAGIFLHNSDGVLINHNVVRDNGRAGIDLDPTSDTNRVVRNVSMGHTYDLENEGGTGNCFKRNSYDTSLGDISC